MSSLEIAQALITPETQKSLSLPMAALILGAISQVESAMEIVDRVCDPLLRGGVTTAGSTVALLVQRELETLSSQ